MKNPLILLLFFVLTIVRCTSNEDIDKMYPSDYLFAQRSFPHGKIDVKAYQAALDTRQQSIVANRSFDEPWLSLGPTNTCGRITDIEMPLGSRTRVYAASASGGIFLSDNAGQDWTPIFDDVSSLSIGDMAISTNNTDLIYVGTGESNAGGGSLAYDGTGVYRSEDAGVTWSSAGLENAGSIGRVAISPEDDNTVFVAAMGALFENDTNGGIYRSTDGGEAWEQVLFLSDSTGGIDLVIHPEDGSIIYAAMWERIRRPYNRQYGGETSGIYRSTDGGDTWEELTSGLPTAGAEKGRIGIAISQSSPQIMYALYADAFGGLRGVFRSDDGGDSWSERSTAGIVDVSFMWWFGRIYIHPTDPNDVYVTSISMSRSRDGGASWDGVFVDVHADQHAIYIHPEREDLVFNGNDGGVYRGVPPANVDSEYLNGMSNFQFYACEIDPNDQTRIYGGSQDNGTNTSSGNPDGWVRILGGDGFRVVVDPTNSDVIYAESQRGNIARSTNGGQSFSSVRQGLSGSFNWNTPIAMDPADNNTLYTGAQSLFKTTNRGDVWTVASPPVVNTNGPSGNLTFGSVTTIDVSSFDSDIIYLGTDDGNLWVTRNGGGSYQDISGGIPERWVTAVVHDPHNEAGVYVTVSGFRFGESEAQVFYSENFGEDWRSIGEGLPDIPVNDILIDPVTDEIVLIATDVGVYYTIDAGENWLLLGANMPIVPITDIDLHPESRTLIAASYGRGMFRYILPSTVSTENISSEEQAIVYSPNPTSGILRANSSLDISSAKVRDASGRTVAVSDTPAEMDISSLQAGLYYLDIITTDNQRIVQKVVRN